MLFMSGHSLQSKLFFWKKFYIERANLVLAGLKLNLTEKLSVHWNQRRREYEDDILDPPSASFVDLFLLSYLFM